MAWVDKGLHLACLALAWLAGSALQLTQPELWPSAAYFGLAAAALVAAFLLRKTTWPLAIVVALLAFAIVGARAQHRLAQGLPAALEGRDIELTGVVASLPQRQPFGTRFEFDVERAMLDGAAVVVPVRLSLGWYRPTETTALDIDWRAGQRWRLTARLRQVQGSMNPHGFDLELWMFEQDLRASGYVRAGDGLQRLDDALSYRIDRLRQHLRDAIVQRIDDPRSAGVLAALVVGDQGAIQRADWELFRTTGIAHLVSISGLHVTMLAWLAGAIVGQLWRRSSRLMLAVPAPLAGRWGGLAAAFAYAMLAG